MSIGLMLFIFLVVLILLSISPRDQWRLTPDDPLNVDELRWPAAGYGSASVSLDCLFGAYSAILLLVGYTCFISIALGVVSALFALNWWISKYDRRGEGTQFQTILYNLQIFKSAALDRAFWMLVVFCQVGLAAAELVLLHNVFSIGLGFSGAHATAASLAISCVAYYYCLFGGYQAAFRTDALRYVFILLMGLVMLLLLWKDVPDLGSFNNLLERAIAKSPAKKLMAEHPKLRTLFELLGGFALGVMPILAAPDAWKRVLIITKKRSSIHVKPTRHRYLDRITSVLRMAPLRLLLAAALPLGLIMPLLLRFSDRGIQDNWSFPVREIFALSPPLADGFIILGMVAAFMSTFDGALLSATHVLLGQTAFPDWTGRSELARFRIMFGFAYAVVFLVQVAFISLLPNPYALGAILVAPFAIVAGILAGTSFGARKAKDGIIYILALTILTWIVFTLRYLGAPSTAKDPYLAAPLVFFGCCVFFLIAGFSRILSARDPNDQIKAA
jgi:Na+/proline symporter